jgi:hypothetical protein
MTQSLDAGSQCVRGRETTQLAYGKGQVAGCAIVTRLGIGELYLENFPVVGVISVDNDTSGLGDVYSCVIPL